MNAFLIVVVVNVNIVCKCVQEDFHTLTYGFKMSGDETDAAVMSPVKELEEELGRIIKVSGALCGMCDLFCFSIDLHRVMYFLRCIVLLHMCCIIVTRWVDLVGSKPNP